MKTKETKKRSLKTRVLMSGIKIGAVLAAVIVTSHLVTEGTKITQAWASKQASGLEEMFTKTRVVKQLVKADDISLDQALALVSKQVGVPRIVLTALVEQESGGGAAVYRFEPHKYAELKAKYRKLSDSEVRMMASSHGVAQVMGFNAEPRCGIHWSELYNTMTGLECGAKILKENLDRHEGQQASKRLWLALRDYNGSGEAAGVYATKVMAHVGELLYAGIDR